MDPLQFLVFHVRLVTSDGHVLCIGRTLTMVYPFHLHHVCVRSCTFPSCIVWPRPFVFGWDQVHPSTTGNPRAQFTWWRCDGSSSSPSMRWKKAERRRGGSPFHPYPIEDEVRTDDRWSKSHVRKDLRRTEWPRGKRRMDGGDLPPVRSGGSGWEETLRLKTSRPSSHAQTVRDESELPPLPRRHSLLREQKCPL